MLLKVLSSPNMLYKKNAVTHFFQSSLPGVRRLEISHGENITPGNSRRPQVSCPRPDQKPDDKHEKHTSPLEGRAPKALWAHTPTELLWGVCGEAFY